MGSLLKDGNDSVGAIAAIVFCLGALMLYYLLYQSKLIPRWISGWGVIAILLNLATILLDPVSSPDCLFDTVNMVMNFPIFLQEMVMAVWLIVRGFSPAALASLSAKPAMNESLERLIDARSRGEGGLKTLPAPSPLRHMQRLVEWMLTSGQGTSKGKIKMTESRLDHALKETVQANDCGRS